jgi:glycosyltransferase involved in cell wall biosynthesis
MRLMLIGTDRALFEQGSVVRARIARLGSEHAEGLDSIVLSTRRHGVSAPAELAPDVHAYPTNSRFRFFYGWDALRIMQRLPRPDIISAQDPFETGLLAFFIAQHFRVPFVVEVHTDFLSPAFARHSLLNRLRVAIAGFVLRKASGGYAVSKRLGGALAARYALKKPFAVLPIFVDTARFRALPRTPRQGQFLWIGRLTPEKNPELALRALAHARSFGHDVRLTMLGQGPLEARLRILAKELDIESVVEFTGWQDPTRYLPNAELLLVTSYFEGYGMALIEALAAGVPVLATDVGIAQEAGARIVREEGYGHALIEWLEGPRARGVLQLQGYATEADYLGRTAEFYASHL